MSTVTQIVEVERETSGRNKGCWIVDVKLVVNGQALANMDFYVEKDADRTEAALVGVQSAIELLEEMVEEGEVTL